MQELLDAAIAYATACAAEDYAEIERTRQALELEYLHPDRTLSREVIRQKGHIWYGQTWCVSLRHIIIFVPLAGPATQAWRSPVLITFIHDKG